MAKKRKFYKKAKLKEKKKEFPINSRIITERIRSDHFIFLTGIILILFAILAVSIDLYSNFKLQKQLTNEKIKVLNDLSILDKDEIKLTPDYRDGQFKLALLSYQLKDFNKANEYLNNAMMLDPNFEKGKELKEFLRNN